MAKILIVDDSIIMRRNLKSILIEGGHEVVAEATNGLQAYQMYVDNEPDIVTMDITMPVMNGIDATKKIINSFPNAKIIMISALDQKVMVFDALQSGAKNYIIKPITVEKILTTIDSVLSTKTVHHVEKESKEILVQESSIPNEPFSIENVSGIFAIKINRELTDEDLTNLQTALQGLFFIKPLRIVFEINCDELPPLQEEILLSQLEKLSSANASIKVISKNGDLSAKIKSNFPKITCEHRSN